MAYFDAVYFLASTSGTGDFGVASAVQGYRTPATASVPNGAVGGYRAESSDLSQWEIGSFTYSTTGPTVARTTVLSNSLGTTAKINFTAAPNVGFVETSQNLADASLLSTGTLAIARLNGGTANQLAQGDGSFIQNTRKLLNTLTASGSASLDDTTSFTSAFRSYEIVLEDIVPATSGLDLRIQVRSGGVFQTASYLAGNFQYNGATPITYSVNLTSGIPLTVGSNTSNSVGYGISGTIRVYSPTLAASVKNWTGHVTHTNAAGNAAVFSTLGGFWKNTAALDGFRLIMSSGALASGSMKVYGL